MMLDKHHIMHYNLFMFIPKPHGGDSMNARRPLINEIYRSCYEESVKEPDELFQLRQSRIELERLLRARLESGGDESRDLLDQFLECTTCIESYTCELYFREGYSYTLKFLAQGLC